MRKTWWHVSGKELDADEREWEIDRKRCWWESQRSIEKVADEREQDGECLITWGKCGPSEAPAEPFLSFLGFRVACFSFFLSKLGQSHSMFLFAVYQHCPYTELFPRFLLPFVFCRPVVCACAVGCFNFHCLCFFVSETSNLFFVTKRFLPTSLHCISEKPKKYKSRQSS